MKLIYGFDPLCGWCFGQTAALAEFLELHPDVDLELQCGGLVVGPRVRPVALDAEYLRRGLARVQAVTGLSAGRAFETNILQPGDYVSDSEPPCRAIATIQHLHRRATYRFAAAISLGFYQRGRRPDDPSFLAELAAAEGVSPDQFLALWGSDEMKRHTQRWFESSRRQGVATYPSFFRPSSDGWLLLGTGFMPAQMLFERLTSPLATGQSAAGPTSPA